MTCFAIYNQVQCQFEGDLFVSVDFSDGEPNGPIDQRHYNKMAANGMYYWTSFLLIGIAIVTVNAVVIITFSRFRSKILHQKNNRILLSLASADFFVGIFSVTFAVSMLAGQGQDIYKSLGNIPLFGSMFMSIFSLILLTFDRLLAIMQPLRYQSIVTGKRLRILFISCWLLSLLLLVQQYILYHCFRSSLELKIRGSLLVVCFFVGATVLGIANCCLVIAIRKQKEKHKMSCTNQEKTTEDDSNKVSGSRKQLTLIRKKYTKIKKWDLSASKECFYIVFIFILSFLPLSVYRLLHACGVSLDYHHARRMFLIMALLSSFINPWIYFFKKRQLRKYLRIKFNQRSANGESTCTT